MLSDCVLMKPLTVVQRVLRRTDAALTEAWLIRRTLVLNFPCGIEKRSPISSELLGPATEHLLVTDGHPEQKLLRSRSSGPAQREKLSSS